MMWCKWLIGRAGLMGHVRLFFYPLDRSWRRLNENRGSVGCLIFLMLNFMLRGYCSTNASSG
jgi:hypothetical protein